MRTSYDVVVAGGGPAGSAAALRLARAGYSVAILERSNYDRPRLGETLPPAVKTKLAQLGLWDAFIGLGPANSPAIHSAWGSEALHEQDHFYNPYGAGWHIDRTRFDRMLASSAQNAGAELITGARVGPVECDDSSVRIGGLRARVILDATGRASAVARRFGVRRILTDKLVAVAGFFAPSLNVRFSPVTLVEAVENGWWYSAALPDGRLVVAWMTDADLYARAGEWLDQIGRTVHTRERIRSAALVSGPVTAQAGSSRLERLHGSNWLAAGDAAVAFDPVAGQGIYRALESGILAGDAAMDLLAGSQEQLGKYESGVSRTFTRFLELRQVFYSLETRWPNSVFWRRRSAAA